MGIPFSYNLRNLRIRRATTLMTALGVALSVLVLTSVLALISGLRKSFEVTADPLHLLVLRSGSSSELVSVVSRKNLQDILSRSGIAKDAAGRPLASLELITVVALDLPDGRDMNVNLRGITAVGWEMRDHLKLVSGRMFRPGRPEIIAGRSIASKCPGARVGEKLHFGDVNWVVVGIVDGGASAFNSEIFADLNQVSAAYHRHDYLSSVLLQAEPGQLDSLARSLVNDCRLSVQVKPEREYYEDQMDSAAPVRFMGTCVAVIMALGSALAAMNTMYTAVARRTSEIGVLRVLGFSRTAVMTSFLFESVLVASLGGALGCLLTLPLNSIETGIGSFTTWSEMTFRFQVTPAIAVAGLLFAVLIGAVGGFLPAQSAANKQVLTALRAR